MPRLHVVLVAILLLGLVCGPSPASTSPEGKTVLASLAGLTNHANPCPSLSAASSSACASACSSHPTCDGFKYDASSGHCQLNSDTWLQPANGTVAGWCPKVKAKQEAANQVKFRPSFSPLKCSTGGAPCQFPFLLGDKLHWDCLEDQQGHPVCNIKEGKARDENEIQKFTDLTTFVPCGECADKNCIWTNASYAGFRLLNQEGTNIYKYIESVDDCQQLCGHTEGCNFFNYKMEMKLCALKYGIGKRMQNAQNAYFGLQNSYFGPKTCRPGQTRMSHTLNPFKPESEYERKTNTGCVAETNMAFLILSSTVVSVIQGRKTAGVFDM